MMPNFRNILYIIYDLFYFVFKYCNIINTKLVFLYFEAHSDHFNVLANKLIALPFWFTMRYRGICFA